MIDKNQHIAIYENHRYMAEEPYFVYFISDGNGKVKVGMTNDIAKRIKDLQTANGAKLKLVGYYITKTKAEASWLEQGIHDYFSAYRLSGEWFNGNYVFSNICIPTGTNKRMWYADIRNIFEWLADGKPNTPKVYIKIGKELYDPQFVEEYSKDGQMQLIVKPKGY